MYIYIYIHIPCLLLQRQHTSVFFFPSWHDLQGMRNLLELPRGVAPWVGGFHGEKGWGVPDIDTVLVYRSNLRSNLI